MSEAAPTQFLYRAAKSFGVYNGPPQTTEVSEMKNSGLELKVMKFSPDGRYVIWASSDTLTIVDANTYKLVASISGTKVLEVAFSPKGTYLMTYERFVKSADGEDHRNVKLYKTEDGTLLSSFVKKNNSDWSLKWTEDETYCAQMLTNSIYFFKPDEKINPEVPVMRLQAEGLKAFSISPGLSPSVAVFLPERKGSPASVRMYSLGSFRNALTNKSFYKAEKVEFMWHNLGVSLLVLTHTDVDKTNKSYYGETNLYYMTATGTFDCKVPLSKEGPIHDVAWNPVEKEFVVIYGFMPAKISLFDSRANEIFSFGTESRNIISFNPQGRALALAGFGNLSGMVDIWDYSNRRLIKSISAHGSSSCSWSPCGRYLLAATLSPRLRVDNGFNIWHYSGHLVHRRYLDELYDVQWRPAPVSLYPQAARLDRLPAKISVFVEQSESKSASSSAAKPVGVYRPPHARNSPITMSPTPRSLYQRETDANSGKARTIPGAPQRSIPGAPPRSTPKSQNSAKSNKSSPTVKGQNAAAEGNNIGSSNKDLSSTGKDKVKKLLNLQKKLKQLETLESKQALGIILSEAQIEKIKQKEQIVSQMKSLNSN